MPSQYHSQGSCLFNVSFGVFVSLFAVLESWKLCLVSESWPVPTPAYTRPVPVVCMSDLLMLVSAGVPNPHHWCLLWIPFCSWWSPENHASAPQLPLTLQVAEFASGTWRAWLIHDNGTSGRGVSKITKILSAQTDRRSSKLKCYFLIYSCCFRRVGIGPAIGQ